MQCNTKKICFFPDMIVMNLCISLSRLICFTNFKLIAHFIDDSHFFFFCLKNVFKLFFIRFKTKNERSPQAFKYGR